MTCKEKLELEHPEFINDFHFGGCKDCPKTYGYLPRPDYCKPLKGREYMKDACTKCWNREISEEKA